MKLTKYQLLEEDLIYDENTVEVKTWRVKHDVNATSYVSKIDDKYWKYTLEFSYNEGCVTFDYSGKDFVEATEVHPVMKTVISWEKVE